jgi:carboxypeptidase T
MRWLAVSVALFLLVLPAGIRAVEEQNPFAPYPTPAGLEREIRELAAAHPDRVSLLEYGKSVEGRPLLCLHIGRPGRVGMPAAWIGGCIHGNEWIGSRLALAMARMLIADDGRDPDITAALDRLDFFVAPCLNPDAYERTFEHPELAGGIAGSGMTLSAEQGDAGWSVIRKNARGVDLNRNFPLPGKPLVPIDWAGSPDPKSVHYRGPRPLSEPETAALDSFFRDHPEIVAALSWHSTAAVMYPAHCPSHACMVRYGKMCRAFQQNQPHRRYPRMQSRVFDSYTGEMEDWLYAEYGVLATDVEIGTSGQNRKACDCDSLFWTFNPKNPDYWVENDAKAGIAALAAAERALSGRRIPPSER